MYTRDVYSRPVSASSRTMARRKADGTTRRAAVPFKKSKAKASLDSDPAVKKERVKKVKSQAAAEPQVKKERKKPVWKQVTRDKRNIKKAVKRSTEALVSTAKVKQQMKVALDAYNGVRVSDEAAEVAGRIAEESVTRLLAASAKMLRYAKRIRLTDGTVWCVIDSMSALGLASVGISEVDRELERVARGEYGTVPSTMIQSSVKSHA